MPIRTEKFVCEFCGDQFDTEQECLNHQAVDHNRDFSDASNEELAKALREFCRCIPPITKEDIGLVIRNPSLSFLQKLRIIRKLRNAIQKSKDRQ